jgi:hypothetical protein
VYDGGEVGAEGGGGEVNDKRQEACNSIVNLEFMNGEKAIHWLTDLFGADEVARIAREHEQTMMNAPAFMGCIAQQHVIGWREAWREEP